MIGVIGGDWGKQLISPCDAIRVGHNICHHKLDVSLTVSIAVLLTEEKGAALEFKRGIVEEAKGKARQATLPRPWCSLFPTTGTAPKTDRVPVGPWKTNTKKPPENDHVPLAGMMFFVTFDGVRQTISDPSHSAEEMPTRAEII